MKFILEERERPVSIDDVYHVENDHGSCIGKIAYQNDSSFVFIPNVNCRPTFYTPHNLADIRFKITELNKALT